MRANNKETRKAVKIGAACIFSYLACYYLRNLLGVATPQMLEQGSYTKEFIGILSSVYFVMYALGQLLNGVMGDFFDPKKMASLGLIVSGIMCMAFPFCQYRISQILCFAVLGFGLSMLRGPLVKTISENTIPKHARIICIFFSYSSFAGTFIASMLMTFFEWKWGFFIAGFTAFISAIVVYMTLSGMEKSRKLHFILQNRRISKEFWRYSK